MTGSGYKVVIAGGGVGGLEAALALSAHGRDQLEIGMVNPEPRFTYRPWSVTTPFGHGSAVELDLRDVAADQGFRLIGARLTGVDPTSHRISTSGGELEYDALVLALGARQVPIVEDAFTFRGPRDARALRDLLAEGNLPDGARVVFVATASAVWSLPAYELALQTAARARRSGRSVQVILTTGEQTPLHDFGPEASATIAALLAERGVELYTHTIPERFDGSALLVPMAGAIPADLAVALPALVGRPIPGIPHDRAGFVEVDAQCRVAGVDNVYAVGDMTARDLKQGGLAAQQADVAAAGIAATAGLIGTVEAYEPILRAMLLTGDEPLYLQHPPGREGLPGAGAEAPWWPAHKIVGLHLGAYLATHAELLVSPESAPG